MSIYVKKQIIDKYIYKYIYKYKTSFFIQVVFNSSAFIYIFDFFFLHISIFFSFIQYIVLHIFHALFYFL